MLVANILYFKVKLAEYRTEITYLETDSYFTDTHTSIIDSISVFLSIQFIIRFRFNSKWKFLIIFSDQQFKWDKRILL